MTGQIEFKGKVNKGIANYWNIMTKDIRLETLRGKTVVLRLITVEETTEKPGAIITETKKVN